MKFKTTLLRGLAAVGAAFVLCAQPALGLVTVTVQPGNQVLPVGINAVFTAQTTATAGETITGYTWLMSSNGLSPFTTIAGATTATCTITNVQLTNAGWYFTRATYSSGTNTGLTSVSAAVNLTVYDQARIVTQPVSGLIRVTGSNASLSVTAAGSAPLSYQWRLNRVSLTNNARITGANGTNLTVTALVSADAGSYDVIVTNVYSAATSQVALLNVFIPPQDTAVVVSSNAVLRVTVSGSAPAGYVWRKNGTNLSNGGRISGATTNKLTIAAVTTNDAGNYSVVLSNSVNTVTSSVAKLTVLVPPTLTSATDAGGRQGADFNFTITATGTIPITFGSEGLPLGLSLEPTNGVISGIPAWSGIFPVTVFATNPATLLPTNAAMTTTGQLVITLTTGVPGITSPLSADGKQGVDFAYSIDATNLDVGLPISFSAYYSPTGLPAGLDFDATNGIIYGNPLVSGLFPITIGATNLYGGDSQVLMLNIASSVPVITSPLSATGKQGSNFTYTIQATENPTHFSASVLPTGLSFDSTLGIISGAPLVNGTFAIPIGATNQWGGDSQVLTLSITSSVPVITSALNASGKQGSNFTYTIRATDYPNHFASSVLPSGLNLDPGTGIISGPPIVSGVFQVTIGASNQFGGDAKSLTITLASALPVITSPLTASGTENEAGFSYVIQANNSPTSYGASNLPAGLTLDPATGIISGTPWYGGVFTVPVWAVNAWGTGSTNVVMTIGYAALSGLTIENVVNTWSTPYLLDFSFALRDGTNPVVRPPSEFQLLCLEDGVPISSEAPPILRSLMSASSKQLKTFLVLDYTYSMLVVPGAISNMEASAVLLINEEPPNALFGVIEFHADNTAPQFVTNRLTTTNNYFITDKTVLSQSIAGIQTNYVKGNYAGTRCWDAMYAALNQFGADNPDEQRYLVAMTDGNDSSSALNTNSDPMAAVITLYELAQEKHVAIYCVAFGNNVNTNSLQLLTSQTGGKYYLAATSSDLASQFQSIQKDISSQYVLRWATLKREAVPAYPEDGFQPSFQITLGTNTASWNTEIVMTNIDIIDDTVDPPETNNIDTNVVQFPFNPPDWAGDVNVGSLRLVTDSDLGPQAIRLRATYVPRFVPELRLSYRPNYPCTATLESTGTNEILQGWTMTETADNTGLRLLTLISPDTNNLLTSIPYAAFGDLVSFRFTYPDLVTATQAFSVFSLDNSVYANLLPTGQRLEMQSVTNFITLYPPAPPHGTPVPWLIYYGFKNNFAAAELIATNGLAVWQAYLAGLNPTNPASRFELWTAFAPGQTPQVMFSTVLGRTYRLETATSLDRWSVLRDNMPGTGDYIRFIDNRTLNGVNAVFYRVAVY